MTTFPGFSSIATTYPAVAKCPNSGFIPQERYNLSRQIIMASNRKIRCYFNNFTMPSSILISPSLYSNRIAGVRIAYLIPVSPLNLPSSMLPSWLFSIHKIRSRGDCDDGPGISSLPELIPMLRLDLFFPGLEGQLADALGELVFVHFFLLFHRIFSSTAFHNFGSSFLKTFSRRVSTSGLSLNRGVVISLYRITASMIGE